MGNPKQAAEFEFGKNVATARTDRGAIASARVARPRGRLWFPLATSTWQEVPDGLAWTPVRATARLGPARVSWTVDPYGPLAWLLPHRPVTGFAITGFRLRFGPRRPIVR